MAACFLLPQNLQRHCSMSCRTTFWTSWNGRRAEIVQRSRKVCWVACSFKFIFTLVWNSNILVIWRKQARKCRQTHASVRNTFQWWQNIVFGTVKLQRIKLPRNNRVRRNDLWRPASSKNGSSVSLMCFRLWWPGGDCPASNQHQLPVKKKHGKTNELRYSKVITQ